MPAKGLHSHYFPRSLGAVNEHGYKFFFLRAVQSGRWWSVGVGGGRWGGENGRQLRVGARSRRGGEAGGGKGAKGVSEEANKRTREGAGTGGEQGTETEERSGRRQ